MTAFSEPCRTTLQMQARVYPSWSADLAQSPSIASPTRLAPSTCRGTYFRRPLCSCRGRLRAPLRDRLPPAAKRTGSVVFAEPQTHSKRLLMRLEGPEGAARRIGDVSLPLDGGRCCADELHSRRCVHELGIVGRARSSHPDRSVR